MGLNIMYCPCIDSIIFLMCTNPNNEDNVQTIGNIDDQPKSIAMNIEYHATVGNDRGTSELGLQIMGRVPFRLHLLVEPGFERLFRAWLVFPKLTKCLFRNDPHELHNAKSRKMLPLWLH